MAVIINKNNEILVARRAKEPAKGTMALPGGFIELNETAEAGVSREVMEETGLCVESVKYLFSLPNIYPYSGIIVDTLDMFFECKILDTNSITAKDDVESLEWIKFEDLDVEKFGLSSIKKKIKRLIDIYK